MKISKNLVYLLIALLPTAMLLHVSTVLASGQPEAGDVTNDPIESGELFLPSDDALADVGNAINAARESGKRVLVLMGANWCHDSRALASRVYQEPLKSLIDEQYETVFVDVGYLDKGKVVISSIGPPVYYATPTVLILDPDSGQLLNSRNRHQWGDANNISMEDSLEYFRLMATADFSEFQSDEASAGNLTGIQAEIDSFEQVQADRLYAAYAVIGPMLRAYKEGGNPELFEAYWNEVRDYRMQVPIDLDSLRVQAYERVSAGESDVRLEYPEYPAFSWEMEE
jgi:hypothetical protein